MINSVQEQYVEMDIADQPYALRISEIHEIVKMQPITRLPSDKPYLLGVITLRGTVIPIVSLRMRFGLPEAAPTKATRIVVVTTSEGFIGMVVDRVAKVTKFPDIQPPPAICIGGRVDSFLSGLGISGSSLVGIMDLSEVLKGTY